jgi:uncharacterized membrane protein
MVEIALFTQSIEVIAYLFGIIGAALIVYGGLKALFNILKLEVLRRKLSYDDIRIDMTNKLVFGLEFFIAADVLKTLITPTESDIILLGAIVVIRVILGYFLSKEAKGIKVD